MDSLPRRSLHATALAACVLVAVAGISPPATAGEAAPAPFPEGHAGDAFPMRVDGAAVSDAGLGNDALHDAVGAAVLSVLPAALGAAATPDLALQTMETRRLDDFRWQLSGEGCSTLPDHGQVGFGYAVVFDARDKSLTRPVLRLGGIAPGERAIPNDPAIVRSLENALLERFAEDLGEPAARLRLDRIETVEVGASMLRVSASGLADFGRSGTSGAEIDGLYERRGGRWRSVEFQLSGEDGWQPGHRPPPRNMALQAPRAASGVQARAPGRLAGMP